jgi:hypothetical protein
LYEPKGAVVIMQSEKIQNQKSRIKNNKNYENFATSIDWEEIRVGFSEGALLRLFSS